MRTSKEIGDIGEQMVADYLKRQGCIIVRQNFKSPFGEIDIVAEEPETVVFVEVKTRHRDHLVAPVDAVDLPKQNRIAKTAEVFLHKAHMTKFNYRFDIAQVLYWTDNDEKIHYSLNYIKNAFDRSLYND